jgi:peptidoglycan/LPS O-acetylase OafA/YrhL
LKRLTEIEGLRGYLAWWVVAGHIVEFSGKPELPGALGLLNQGPLAVDVFIVISGFVICYLLDSQREGYGTFLFRRALRLLPLFLVTCIAGAALLPWEHANLLQLQPVLPGWLFQRFLSINQAASDQLTIHLLSHAVMLHGALPHSLVPWGSFALLPPGWSISLEWQFYLVAPLVWWGVRRTPIAGLGVGVAAVAGFLLRDRLAGFNEGAFLPMRLDFFALGILSYVLYRFCANRDRGIGQRGLVYLPLACIGAVLLVFPEWRQLFQATRPASFGAWFPATLWGIFFSLLLATRFGRKSRLAALCTRPFDNAAAQILGRLSYGTYLTHLLALHVVQYGYFAFGGPARTVPLLLATAIGTVPLTLALAAGSHRWIEQPAIAFGRRWKARS